MRHPVLPLALALIAPAVLSARPALGKPIQLLAADAAGVTIRVTPEAWVIGPPGPDGRVRVAGVPLAHSLGEPGRAKLPAYATMLVVPPDARPIARVIGSGAPVTRDGVKLEIAGRPDFVPDPDFGGEQPIMTPMTAIADGPWPREPFVLGSPSRFRGRALVSLEVRPFRYDEVAARLTVTPSLTIRVDFNRALGARALAMLGTGGPDPGMDAAMVPSVLNFAQGRAWRLAPTPARSTQSLFARPGGSRQAFPFDENEPEVRVQLDSTGIYLLPFDLLSPPGTNRYPAGVPIAEVSVHRHEFLEGMQPPYETSEVPIEIEDANDNGVFDSGDRIWIYVRNWAARSQASQYQRWWGDGEVVFVTRNRAGGLRMSTRQGWRNQSLVAQPTSYPSFRHYEINGAIIMPFVGIPGDTGAVDVFHWTPYAFYYDRPDTIVFDANDIDTTRSTQFSVNWIGRKFSTHYEWAAVHNGRGQVTSIADSAYWTNKSPFTATNTLRGSALSEGHTNAMRLWGKANAGPPSPGSNDFDAAGMDWFEVTYWRRYNAVHDVLVANSADASGEIQVHATGFLADSVRLYDVTNPEFPVRLILDRSHVTAGATLSLDFQDSVAVSAPHQYVIAAAQEPLDPAYGPHVPPASEFAAVTRRQLYASPPVDYLLIVPEAFLPAVQPLVNLRTSQGIRVLVAPAEDVYDEFNGGRHSAAAIQRFVKYAYDNWSARFVLLFGDGTLDPQGFSSRSGRDWIPILPSPGPVTVGEGFELVPSDNRYGFLTGNPDPITGIGDVLPEMMVGRLTSNSLADANAIVAKLVAYETLTGDPSWRRHILLNSDDAYSTDAFLVGGATTPGYCHKYYEEYFVGLNEICKRIITRDAGLSQMNVELFNDRYYLANETYYPPGTPNNSSLDTCRADRSTTQAHCHALVTPQLMSRLNGGVLWWNFQGHANEYVLTHEDLYVNSGDTPSGDDKYLLANDGKPFLYTAFSCHANMFARQDGGPGTPLGGCLGEDLLDLPSRGAMGSWASVCYEVVPRDDTTHINVELCRSMFAEPPQDEFVPGDRGARVVLGEVIQESFLRYIPTVASYGYERGLTVTYSLLGDPATRISIGRPQSIVYANDSLVFDQTPVRLHTPGDTLTLVADLVSTERLDSLGLYENDGAGDVPIPATSWSLTPAFPDTAGGGVWGGRRFRLTYATHNKAQSYHYVFRTRDRDGLMTDFTVPFVLDGTLRADGVPIHDGDDVSPKASMAMQLICPKPLTPATDLVMLVNGTAQAFTATPSPGDASGREWILSWTHAEYAKDDYIVNLTVQGNATVTRRFRVSIASGELRVDDLFAFPNPFDNDGTTFSFFLAGSDAADVRISVFTISGRVIYANVVRGLSPGYHQVEWDGRDAEGDALANGVYFYRLNASVPGGAHTQQLGRLVKLRKPRHVDVSTAP